MPRWKTDCKCECNCRSEHDKYVTREEMEEILSSHRTLEAKKLVRSRELMEAVDKVLAQGLDYCNSMRPDAR
jgi:hypothetical protein